MSSTRFRRALRRCLTVIAGATALTVVGAGAALAFDSPGKPPGPGNQTITWSGQGTSGGHLDNSQCEAANDPLGKDQPYLLWILNMKGTVTTDATTPALTLGGSGSGTYHQSAPFTSNNVHIVTPYFDPDGLTASVAMNVLTVGNGQWQLVISHGCAGPNNPPPPPPPAALPLTATKTAYGTFDTTYQWTIAKAADKTQINSSDGNATFHYTVTVGHDGGSASNWQVNGIIDVTNPNGGDAVITGVTDTLSDGTPCNVDLSNGLTVPANGDTTYPYSCSLSGVPANPLNNTATVSWNDQPVAGTAGLAGSSADAVVNGIGFNQDKVIDGTASVSDTLGGDLGTVSVSDPNPTEFGYDYTFTGDPVGKCTDHNNTATFTTNSTGTTDSASAAVTQCVGADLDVTKTAAPSFDHAYAWDVHKAVDKTKVEQTGGNATFNYTVSVHHDNGTDGNWQVKGNIHVANPNDWEAITLTDLSDGITNGGTCTLDNGSAVGTVLQPNGQAGDSADFAYTCRYSSAPSPLDGTNTATASWDQGAANTPHGSANGTADANFGSVNPKIVDDQVAVNDSQAGNLGTVGLSDPNPKLFPYSKTFPVPTWGCLTYPNTATFTTNTTGTTGQASQSVQVCGPAKTGALTMGYWQNKNGQAIIGTAALGSPLANYIKGFASFGDYPQKSGQTVAQYFTAVFNAANASGTGTPMLKAQMLATALDVYFWQQIGAPANIGNVSIDTSAWSGAFGATSMKVSDMLSYASSHFGDAGGWYSGNKSLVTTAITAFNAINNQTAFGG